MMVWGALELMSGPSVSTHTFTWVWASVSASFRGWNQLGGGVVVELRTILAMTFAYAVTWVMAFVASVRCWVVLAAVVTLPSVLEVVLVSVTVIGCPFRWGFR